MLSNVFTNDILSELDHKDSTSLLIVPWFIGQDLVLLLGRTIIKGLRIEAIHYVRKGVPTIIVKIFALKPPFCVH